MDGFGTILSGVVEFLAGVFTGDWDKAWEGLKEVFEGLKMIVSAVIEAIKNYFKTLWETIKTAFTSVWESITELWQAAAEWFDENVIQPIKDVFAPIGEVIGKIFEGCWIIIQAVWKIVSEWFDENVIQPVTGIFKKLWENVSMFFKNLWEDILAIWQPVAEWFDKNVIEPVVGFFKTAWDNIVSAFKTAFNAISNFAKSIFNGVIALVEGIINRIIQGINGIISRFNSVVSWAADVIGTNWDGLSLISEVYIPRLAQGTVVPANREFLAVLGDNKREPEVVSPLSTIRQAVAEALAANGGGSAEQITLLRQQNEILMALLEKEITLGEPNASFGRFANRSIEKYAAVSGVK